MNLKNKIAFMLTLIVLASSFAGVARAAPLPIVIDRVELDDIKLERNDVNRLDIERGNTYEAEVRYTALADADDVEMEVFVSGFEYGGITSVAGPFDVDAGDTHNERFDLTFPDDVEEDDYRLRVLVTNRDDDAIIQDYNLKLDVPRHGLKIEDVYFQPSGPVRAGEGLLTTVRVENKGEQEEDSIRVSVAIPQLGVEGIDYIEELEDNHNEEASTEEIFLRLPACAEPGVYQVRVQADFDELTRSVTKTGSLIVEENPRCAERQNQQELQAQLMKLLQEQHAQESDDADAQAMPEPESTSKVRQALQVTLLVLLVLLVIVGLVFVFTRNDEF